MKSIKDMSDTEYAAYIAQRYPHLGLSAPKQNRRRDTHVSKRVRMDRATSRYLRAVAREKAAGTLAPAPTRLVSGGRVESKRRKH
jgi:hypothetical protein